MSGISPPMRVLHVDDDPDLADLVATYLEREDERISVETAGSAAEGIERLDDVDCVVSDFDMPGMDGIEFLESVRAEYPDLPFILYTGKGSEEVASEAIAADVTDYLQKGQGTSQYAVLANRIVNAVEGYRSTERAGTLDRIRTLLREIDTALIRASTRTEIESRVCEILSHSEPYVFVWIGIPDREAGVVRPRCSSGGENEYLESIDITIDDAPTSQGPTGRAVSEGTLVVTQSIAEDPAYDPWREAALERGFRASAAVPLAFQDTVYGVLNVYTDHEFAFDERQRELLSDLGENVGHAINRIESEGRYRKLFDRFPEPTVAVSFDRDTPIIEGVNPAFETVFGYDSDEIRGASANDVLVPEERGEEAADIDERSKRGQRIDEEIERKTVGGRRRFRLRNIPIPGEAGPDLYWVYTDITSQERHREALDRERERFAALFESFPASVVAVNYVDGEPYVRDVNSTFETVFGYDADRIHGEPLNDYVVPEETRGEASVLDRRLQERDLIDVEVVRSTADGPRDFVLRTITLAPEHELDLYAVYIDVTERKKRERAMAALHDAAVELEGADTPEGVYAAVVDAAETILEFAMIRIDIVEDGSLVRRAGSVDGDESGPAERVSLESDTLAARALRNGEAVRIDDLEGTEIDSVDPAYRSAMVIPIGETGVFRTVSSEPNAFDETDRELAELLVRHALEALRRVEQTESLRRQRERLRRENERLDTVVHLISHDIRNPLSVAKGRVQLAGQDGGGDHLDITMNALERMDAMVEDVLAWVRGGQYVADDEREYVDVAALARTSWQTVQTEKATLSIETDRTVSADGGRLQHVFENLFRNSVEHGGETLDITVGDLEDGVFVADNGPGVPPEERQKVFEHGHSTNPQGSGFGLSIVREIIEAHGWNVSLSESVGGGARFDITNVDVVD